MHILELFVDIMYTLTAVSTNKDVDVNGREVCGPGGGGAGCLVTGRLLDSVEGPAPDEPAVALCG